MSIFRTFICPDCGKEFTPRDAGIASSMVIFEFFTPETLKGLIGSPSKLSIGTDLCISQHDGVFFPNKEVDELTVTTIGMGKYTDIIAAMLNQIPLSSA